MKELLVGFVLPLVLATLGWAGTLTILHVTIGAPRTTTDFVLASIGGLVLMGVWACFMYIVLKWLDDHL